MVFAREAGLGLIVVLVPTLWAKTLAGPESSIMEQRASAKLTRATGFKTARARNLILNKVTFSREGAFIVGIPFVRTKRSTSLNA